MRLRRRALPERDLASVSLQTRLLDRSSWKVTASRPIGRRCAGHVQELGREHLR